jgi:hypothetical protein
MIFIKIKLKLSQNFKRFEFLCAFFTSVFVIPYKTINFLEKYLLNSARECAKLILFELLVTHTTDISNRMEFSM